MHLCKVIFFLFKLAILNSGGIVACSKLLYKTSSIDVREHITGILYNISSVQVDGVFVLCLVE